MNTNPTTNPRAVLDAMLAEMDRQPLADRQWRAHAIHGAAQMAYMLGMIDVDTWDRYAEQADQLATNPQPKTADPRQMPLVV